MPMSTTSAFSRKKKKMHKVGDVVLRMLEPRDIDALLEQKNDVTVAGLLGGFSTGYSRKDLEGWLEFHRTKRNEVLWAIADGDDKCLGHVGLYEIDHRVRKAEFAIMLGERRAWGKGIGKAVSAWAVEYGFLQLNLNRIELDVLATNPRAKALYEGLGFELEGTRRCAQYKDGEYIDVYVMGLLRAAWEASR